MSGRLFAAVEQLMRLQCVNESSAHWAQRVPHARFREMTASMIAEAVEAPLLREPFCRQVGLGA